MALKHFMDSGQLSQHLAFLCSELGARCRLLCTRLRELRVEAGSPFSKLRLFWFWGEGSFHCSFSWGGRVPTVAAIFSLELRSFEGRGPA